MRPLLLACSLFLSVVPFAGVSLAGGKPPPPAKKLDLRHTDLFLSTLDGKSTKLAPVAGKVVTLVNLWATWCSPCVGEMPALSKLHDKYKARGVQVVGINVDENPAVVQQFLAKHPVAYPVLTSTPNKTVAALGELEALPTSLLLDETGDVSEVIVGVLEIPELERAIEKKLAAKKR